MSKQSQLFDRQRLARHQPGSAPADDFVTDLIYADLIERLTPVARTFDKALLVVPAAHHGRETLILPDQEVNFESFTSLTRTDPLADLSALDQDYDLVVSLYDFAIVDDVPNWIRALSDRLKPDGLFTAAFPGGLTLTELRQSALQADSKILGGAVQRVAPMIDTREAGALIQSAQLALPVADVETHIVRYADPIRLIAEIRALGAGNPLSGRPAPLRGKSHFGAILEAYQENFSDTDGRVRATLELIWMSGWRPHESQQKPLKPGSATAKLADILKDRTRGD